MIDEKSLRPSLQAAPVAVLAAMVALVAVATGNLSGVGIGDAGILYDTVALPRLVAAAVLTSLALALTSLRSVREGGTLRWDAVLSLLTLLALWSWVSALSSPHRLLAILGQSERLEGAITVVLYALVYGVTLQVIRSSADIRLVAGAIGASAIFLSLFGIVQYFGLDPTRYMHEGYGFDLHRAFATLGNPNFLAGLLVLALPIAAALGFVSATPPMRIAWLAGAAAIGLAIVMSFTRGAWLAVFAQAGVALLVWIRDTRRRDSTARAFRPAAAIILVAVTLTLALAVLPSSSNETDLTWRLTSLFQPSGSSAERFEVARTALEAVGQHPVLGYGPDAFLPAFRQNRTDMYAQVFGADHITNNAHSVVLQYAVTLGIPGVVLFASAIALALFRTRPVRAEVSPFVLPSRETLLTAGIWIGVLGLVIHLQFNVAVLASSIPALVMLGMLGAPASRVLRVPKGAWRGVAAAGLALMVFSVVGSVRALEADNEYLAARTAYHSGDAHTSIRLAAHAHELNPLSVKYARGVASGKILLVQQAIVRQESVELVDELYEQASDELAEVLVHSPNDYPAHAWLAALQAQAGDYLHDETLLNEARHTAALASELDRHHVQVQSPDGEWTVAAIAAAQDVPALP